jgi:hypothetical protein
MGINRPVAWACAGFPGPSPLSFQAKRHCRLIVPRSVTLIGTAPDAARYSTARFLFGGFASMAVIDSDIRGRRQKSVALRLGERRSSISAKTDQRGVFLMKNVVDILYYVTALAAALLWFKSASARLAKIGAGLEHLDHVTTLSSDLQRAAFWNGYAAVLTGSRCCCSFGEASCSALMSPWKSCGNGRVFLSKKGAESVAF